MSACARCGRQQSAVWPGTSGVNPSVCYVAVSKGTGEHDWVALDCRDRELANLRALLRSVTRDLEAAAELNEANELEASLSYIQKALEALA